MDPMLIIFIVLCLSAFIGLALYSGVLNTLKNKHGETWKALGEPSLFLNNSVSNSFSVQGFIFGKKYKELNDPDFTKQCNILRIFQLAYILFFASILIMILMSTLFGISFTGN